MKMTGKFGFASRRWRRLYIGVTILALLSIVLAVSPLASLAQQAAGREREEAPVAGPLTDVAPPQREVEMAPGESPYERLESLAPEGLLKLESLRGQPDGVPARLPGGTAFDFSNPPQWTNALASPPAQLEPPDPFQEPALFVDPARKPQAEGERLSPGVYREPGPPIEVPERPLETPELPFAVPDPPAMPAGLPELPQPADQNGTEWPGRDRR